jgi:glycosyltransferase 2 family protein
MARQRSSRVGFAVASTSKDKKTRRQPASDDGQAGFAANWRSWLLALLLIAGVVVAGFHWGDVKKFAELLTHAQPLWLLAALAAQVGTYVTLAFEWSRVLHAGRCPAPFGKLLGLTVAKHFADQMVPTAGMSGNVVVADRLTRIGSSRPVAMAAVIMAIIAYYGSYAAAAVVALIFFLVRGGGSWFAVALIGAFLALAAAIPALSLWLQEKGKQAIPEWLQRFDSIRELFEMIGEAPSNVVRDRRLLGELTLLNGTAFALDALTMLLCLFALGQRAPFDTAFVALIMASIVVTLGPIPMGLGSFEAVSIATLRAKGVPFEAALSATLLFRGYTLWIPLIPGMFAARRQLKSRKKKS